MPFKSAVGAPVARKAVRSSIEISSADFADLIVARPGLFPGISSVDLGRLDLHFSRGSLLRAFTILKQHAAFLTLVVFHYAGSDAGRSLAVDSFRAVSGLEAEGDIHSGSLGFRIPVRSFENVAQFFVIDCDLSKALRGVKKVAFLRIDRNRQIVFFSTLEAAGLRHENRRV